MQEHCGAAIQVFHQVSNKLWPVIKVSDTLQGSCIVICNLLKYWHLTWTGWGGTLWQYLPVQLYICIYLVVCTFMVCVKLKNEEQLELPHLEGCKSEGVLFVVIGNLQSEWVSRFPLQLQSDRVFFTLLWICKTSAIAPLGKSAICLSALLFLWRFVFVWGFFLSHTLTLWCCNWNCCCCKHVFPFYIYTLALFSMFQMKRWCQCWQRESSDKGRKRYTEKRWITTWLQATQNPSPAARWVQ